MKYLQFSLVLIAAAFLMCEDAKAILGETEAVSQEKAAQWRANYGAVEGLFEIGAEGVVVQECWSAPAAYWSLEQALAFVRELIPGGAGIEFTRKDNRGSKWVYVVPGFDIELSVDQKNRVYGADVATASFDGWRC